MTLSDRDQEKGLDDHSERVEDAAHGKGVGHGTISNVAGRGHMATDA